jgi:TolB-like protein
MILATAIVLLLIAAGFFYKNFSGNTGVVNKEKTIAILPFKNISVNKEENEPFCVGVALELQKKIELLGALIPIAPQSVERFRDTKLSIADIAKDLGGISYILQGNVLRDKNKIKVFVSLIDALSGKEKWSKDYSGEVEDVFTLQENIAQQIASELQVKITPDEQSRIARIATKNTKALDAYNEAQLNFVKYAFAVYPDEKDYIKIQALCDKAILIDSNLAEAYVLKARAYWIANGIKQFFSENFMDTVKLLCLKALKIDNNSVDALVQLSEYYTHTGRKGLALEDLQKAIAISPNSFAANLAFGKGNPDLYYDPIRSIQCLRKALKLDPLSVWTPEVYNAIAYQYLFICDYNKSQLYSNRVLELEQTTVAASKAYWCLVVSNNRLGNGDKCIELAEKWNKIDSSEAFYHMAEAYCYLKKDYVKGIQVYEHYFKISPLHINSHRWAIALYKTGKQKEALALFNKSLEQYKKLSSLGRFDSAQYDVAGVYAFMGDKKRAYNILKLWGAKEHWPWGSPNFIKFDPLFENLWPEKEFKDLVQSALDEKTKLKEKIQKMDERGEL